MASISGYIDESNYCIFVFKMLGSKKKLKERKNLAGIFWRISGATVHL